MKLKLLLIYIVCALALCGCANPGSGPDGGPYDETPPRIVAMSPALGTTGVKSKKVTILFDELIKVENAQEKVIVSPPQIENPEIKTSGRRISVELIDTLKENTTYTIDFSDAIVDMNEGNALGNFTYCFSTGSRVDSMEVAGYVLQAVDLEPVKGILVGLHSNLADSTFTTQPFERVARTDANGHFVIKGVAPGTYRAYALKDMDNDFKYMRGEMLAFSRDTIVPSSFPDVRHDTLWADTVHIDTIRAVPYTHYMPDNVVLLAFTERNQTRQLLKTEREPGYFKLYFTAPSKHEPQLRGLDFDARNAWIVGRNAGNDTLTYWLRDTALVNRDSLGVIATYECTDDSTGVNFIKEDTLYMVPRFSYERRQKLKEQELEKWRKQQEKRRKRGQAVQDVPPVEPLKMDFSVRSSMAPDRNLHFKLEEPAERLDTALFHLFLKVDSTFTEAPFRLSRDTLSLLDYTLRGAWRPGQEYVLNVDSAAVTGLSGKVTKTFDAQFRIAGDDAYGALFLIIPDADSTAVAQLIASGEKVSRQLPVKNGRVDFFYLEPGQVFVRLFNDRNGNGRWDEGDYAAGRQAEEVYYYPQPFQIRANWDVEQTWRIHDLPLNKQKPVELIKQKENKKQTPKNRNAERLRQKRGG